MNRGILYGVLAFLCWGLFPLYWKALGTIPTLQVLSHRIVWSIVWLALLITLFSGWNSLLAAIRNPKLMRTLAISSVMLSINWVLYIWAVNTGHVIETSLGYFINPLISVLLGVIFLKERLWPMQTVAVVVAALGVLYLTYAFGQLPWISLSLALSFAYYGLLKKQTDLKATEGLFIETMFVLGFAVAYLIWAEFNGTGVFGHTTWDQTLLLVLAGIATALPLLLFAAAARRIPLSMVGFLQYIAPSIQFLLGVFLYNEPFSQSKFIGFGLIWTALLIFSVDGLRRNRRARLDQAIATQFAN